MALNDFMQQGSGGTVNVLIEKLPSNGFIDAIKVKDIGKVRILAGAARAGLKPGSPDVELKLATGETKMISRKDLVSKFKHSNGKKIILAVLKNNTTYVVTRDCNEKYKIIKLPDNCIGSFKGKTVKNGSYLVCRQDENGNVNMNTLGVVSPGLFRKMFKIPMQDIIRKHLNDKGKKNFTLFSKVPLRRNSNPIVNGRVVLSKDNTGSTLTADKPVSRIDTSKLGINPSSFNIPTAAERRAAQSSNNVQTQKYRYRALNQIIGMDSGNKPIGYTLVDLETGERRPVYMVNIVKLCEQKKIENIMLVKKENGTRYLKGNGVVLENLPKILA